MSASAHGAGASSASGGAGGGKGHALTRLREAAPGEGVEDERPAKKAHLEQIAKVLKDAGMSDADLDSTMKNVEDKIPNAPPPASSAAAAAASGGGAGYDSKSIRTATVSAATKELASDDDVMDALGKLLNPAQGARNWLSSEEVFWSFARRMADMVRRTGGVAFGAEFAPKVLRAAAEVLERVDGHSLTDKAVWMVTEAVRSGVLPGMHRKQGDPSALKAADKAMGDAVKEAVFAKLGLGSSLISCFADALKKAEKQAATDTAASRTKPKSRGGTHRFRARSGGRGGRWRARSSSPPRRYNGGGGGGGGNGQGGGGGSGSGGGRYQPADTPAQGALYGPYGIDAPSSQPPRDPRDTRDHRGRSTYPRR